VDKDCGIPPRHTIRPRSLGASASRESMSWCMLHSPRGSGAHAGGGNGGRVYHWWKKGLWSRFIWAIGPGCRTRIHYSGPMPVPVPARTGTDRSPRGRAAARGGLSYWSRFVGRAGIVDPGFFSHLGFRVLFGMFCI
jgi:hypothetical protein